MTISHKPTGDGITRGIGPTVKSSTTVRRIRRHMFLLAAEIGMADMQARHGNCAWCGIIYPFQSLAAGHIIPRDQGGLYWPSNLLPTCQSCNTVMANGNPLEMGYRPKYDSTAPVAKGTLAADLGADSLTFDSTKLWDRA